jgi:ferric-dicitrate binding protein FerR (iron transport regulator)
VVLVDGNDIESGGNKAQLTWENGQTIDLSGSQEGIVVGGDLRYEDGAAVSDNLLLSTTAETNPQPQKMTLQTPKGGMYRITLPDNTKVWLNADSRLSYPSTFAENERRVELEGEAYFEVSKLVMKTADLQSKNVPFIVSTAKQSVEVLGTQFNLSSYPDEAKTSTTLVEGSVRITNAQSGLTKMLRPGEQSVVLGNLIQTRTVDVASFVAWKNDMFYFEETPLKSALVQIGRWYDVEIEYKDKIPDTYLYGIISRKKSLSHVLAVLAESGDIKFKIETSGAQNKLTVL